MNTKKLSERLTVDGASFSFEVGEDDQGLVDAVRALEARLDKAQRDFEAERRRADELAVLVRALSERAP